ncbi:serine protease [Paenibacillus swuensis]|uniref:Serine protease n=1 Tax=Paenibacillus swuensis TaxID=1178515 RepID=A0A172TIF0_9BACL|nr:PDZ domain-containing protein [Paenibacillus swuensis]ANE46742.1 serine protease [Paenibacillus swuensis]
MDTAIELLQRFAGALLQLLIQPFYYIGILLIVLQYRRQIRLERKLFHTKLHSLMDETLRTIGWGFAGGLAASVLLAFTGVQLKPETIVLLWAVSVLLMFVRSRYLCFAYSIGMLGIVYFATGFLPESAETESLGWLVAMIRDLDMPGLLALVAVVHAVEAVLVRTQGQRSATPLFMESKRGKVVGGFQLYGFWPVPLFLTVPVASGGSSMSWPTLFDGLSGTGGWTFMAFPLIIGFTEMTITRLPGVKVRLSSALLMAYSLIILAFAIAAGMWNVLILPASIAAVLLHEAMIWYSLRLESEGSPMFVHDRMGLMVLDVLPGSPAHELGIQTGERIHKVNGVRVNRKEDLHAALALQSAFCKLEVMNLEGQSKFLQRALFAGEHHLLGVILAPDQQAMYVVETKQTNLWTVLSAKLTGVSSQRSSDV